MKPKDCKGFHFPRDTPRETLRRTLSMKIDVKHIQKRGKAGWRYRRKIPEELRAILGKREHLVPLGATEQQALKNYPKVHAEAERLLLSAIASKKAPSLNSPQPLTALEQFKIGAAVCSQIAIGPGMVWFR
ncbi:MAG: hypothetical protein E5V36_02670 [Mesorhizobium sp.]|nr:MAG: hypothetical protein E5V36_02670 [Mesorhizobium sp.]